MQTIPSLPLFRESSHRTPATQVTSRGRVLQNLDILVKSFLPTMKRGKRFVPDFLASSLILVIGSRCKPSCRAHCRVARVHHFRAWGASWANSLFQPHKGLVTRLGGCLLGATDLAKRYANRGHVTIEIYLPGIIEMWSSVTIGAVSKLGVFRPQHVGQCALKYVDTAP